MAGASRLLLLRGMSPQLQRTTATKFHKDRTLVLSHTHLTPILHHFQHHTTYTPNHPPHPARSQTRPIPYPTHTSNPKPCPFPTHTPPHIILPPLHSSAPSYTRSTIDPLHTHLHNTKQPSHTQPMLTPNPSPHKPLCEHLHKQHLCL